MSVSIVLTAEQVASVIAQAGTTPPSPSPDPIPVPPGQVLPTPINLPPKGSNQWHANWKPIGGPQFHDEANFMYAMTYDANLAMCYLGVSNQLGNWFSRFGVTQADFNFVTNSVRNGQMPANTITIMGGIVDLTKRWPSGPDVPCAIIIPWAGGTGRLALPWPDSHTAL